MQTGGNPNAAYPSNRPEWGLNMSQKTHCPFTIVIIFSSLVLANGWQDKPFMEWNVEDISQVLNDSPWVSYCAAGFQSSSNSGNAAVRRTPDFYRIRLLTAKPVREALLRCVSLGLDSPNLVDARSLKLEVAGEDARARLERFIEANLSDIRVKANDESIVIALTRRNVTGDDRTPHLAVEGLDRSNNGNPEAVPDLVPARFVLEEITAPEELMGLKLPDIEKTTFLSTKRGRPNYLTAFEPPGRDGLGAKFYFPRKLPNGNQFVAPDDKELRFQTQIGGRKVTAKFHTGKLVYKGKSEL